VPAQFWLLATGLLGAVFLGLELSEFAEMIGKGAGPQRSAFLSAFYGLVGLHGLHIAVGLLWLGTMMAQLWVKGFRPQVLRRLMCFNLFWHALDIVWVGIFTMVYLMGVAP
jgi:cytochrome o ubiquinol oxidase subunit 3